MSKQFYIKQFSLGVMWQVTVSLFRGYIILEGQGETPTIVTVPPKLFIFSVTSLYFNDSFESPYH